jgi:Carboxypeptidase regulatory-like domain
MSFRIFCLIFALLFAGSGVVNAQGSVTIFGTATDPSGAAVAGGTVTATHTSTGAARQTSSGADGNYVISQLPIGTYTVTAEAAGFKKFIQDNILVQVDENRRVNVAFQVGTINESVTVQAEAAQVETRTGTLQQVIDSSRIVELPLNGRNPLQLQYLVAGAGGVVSAGQEQNDSVSINGSRPNTNNYTLDGADNHDPYFNTPSIFPNPDALAEFSLETNSYPADRGRNAGAVMNAVTRSGTNLFHGTLFEFVRNTEFNARGFFAKDIPPFKRNQFGGTLGGPIRKDKTFFFGSYQRTTERSSPGALNPIVLSAPQRTGNFSDLRTALKDPLGGTFPNNTIPASRLNKAALKFMEAFVPLPNAPLNVYSYADQQKIDDDQVVAKIDHQLRSNNQLSGRLLYNRNNNYQSANNLTLPGFLAQIAYRNWSVAVSDNHVISPHLINSFTFSYNNIRRDQQAIVPGNKSWGDLGAGFIRAYPDDPNIGWDTNVQGYFRPQSRYPLHHYRKEFQFSDGINWTLGSHFLKIGADFRRNLLTLQEDFQTDPALVFNGYASGNAAADLLLGLPNQFTQIAPDANRPRNLEVGAYIQDDWKISQRLTVNLGMRWDPFFPNSDPDGRFAQFRAGLQSTRFAGAPVGYVFPGDPGVPQATIKNRVADFGPRFGFAWDPFGKGHTSVRGGYGMFFSQVRQQANNQISNNQPFSLKLTVNQPSGGLNNPYADSGNPFPFRSPTTPQETAAYKFLLPLNITQWDPNFRNAIIQQWNFTLQHQFFGSWIATAAYVGNKGNHLFLQQELNPAIFGAPGRTVDARRTYAPTFTSMTSYPSVGNSTYHALQLSVNKRLTRGLTVLANYTWSKMLDNGSGDGDQPSNPLNFSNEKGPSNQDIPQRIVGSFIWQMPALAKSNVLVRQALGGWELNGITVLQSQTPFSITAGKDNSGSAVNQDRADVVGDWHIPDDRSKNDIILRAFNPAAFAQNRAGTFGNAGRNILRGMFRENLDFGAIKNFAITERHKVQFRAEIFNILNHANLGNPNGNQSAVQFGRITGASAPRVIQLALKYIF